MRLFAIFWQILWPGVTHHLKGITTTFKEAFNVDLALPAVENPPLKAPKNASRYWPGVLGVDAGSGVSTSSSEAPSSSSSGETLSSSPAMGWTEATLGFSRGLEGSKSLAGLPL